MRFLITCALLLQINTGLAVQAEADAGERLYLSGEGAQAILAGGQVQVPAKNFACAGCHGKDARGGREGGTEFPPLLWRELTDESRTDKPYDAKQLAKTLETGKTPDGRLLSVAMPRYRASSAVFDDLALYLSELGLRQRQGINADSIAIAIPTTIEESRAFVLALEAANEAGGVWGRRFIVGPSKDSLVNAEEAEAVLAPAFDRAIAASAAHGLTALGSSSVSLEKGSERLATFLKSNNIKIDKGAEAVLSSIDGGSVLIRKQEKRVRVEVRRDLLIAPGGSDVSPLFARTLLTGIEMTRAVLECGRSVTQACVMKRLGAVDLSTHVAAKAF